MGEYWKPVNLTRKEWIHPHHMDEGLKWGEWTHAGSNVVKYMASAWSDTDLIYAVSDYGGSKLINHKAEQLREPAGHEDCPDYDQLGEDWGTEVGALAELKRFG